MPDARRVLVLAPNWLGDAVLALPAIDDFRRQHPGAALVIAARRSVAQLFAMVPEVAEVVELEGRSRGRGGVAGVRALLRDARRLRQVRADVALLLPNSFVSAVVAWLARVPQRWGYSRDGRAWLLTRSVAPPHVRRPDDGRAPAAPGVAPRPAVSLTGLHQGAYYQHLVRALGAANGPLTPRLLVAGRARDEARALLAAAGWPEGTKLVVFAPGAAYGTAKRWVPSHFASLANALVADHAAHVVLVGSVADAGTTAEVRAAVTGAARDAVSDLTGRTDLATLAGVLSLAAVCVSNDSGAMHVAAAAGVPLAALFGPTNEHETAPLAHAPMALLLHEVPCRPCMLRECPIDHPCMRDLAPATVLDSVRRLLAAGPVDEDPPPADTRESPR